MPRKVLRTMPSPPIRAWRRVALAGFAALAALAAFLSCAGSAEAQIKTRKADCYVELDGKPYIDGVCEFLTDDKYYGVGGFRLANYDDGHVRYFAELTITSPGFGNIDWNETAGAVKATGNLGPVGANGACWKGDRARICAWKIGEGRPGFEVASAPGRSQGTFRERAADCFLEIDGQVQVDGACRFMTERSVYGAGGFGITTFVRGRLQYLAEVHLNEAGAGTAVWNERAGSQVVSGALGAVEAKGACWENSRARICAWNAGESRGDFQREQRSERADSNPSAPARPTAEAQPAGKTLTLTFRGACESLLVDGDLATKRCAPTMSNLSVTGSAKAEFSFRTTDGTTLVFQGQGQGQVVDSALRQPIGAVTLGEGGASMQIEAKGECLFPDPMSGPILIQCNAQSGNGKYEARFKTDGTRPEIRQ